MPHAHAGLIQRRGCLRLERLKRGGQSRDDDPGGKMEKSLALHMVVTPRAFDYTPAGFAMCEERRDERNACPGKRGHTPKIRFACNINVQPLAIWTVRFRTSSS